MSAASSSLAAAGAESRPPFTAAQWKELEHQALIYKYLMAGLPVPPDLVVPIRRSFDSISPRFLHHPSLAYSSYYGKKFDPEPGRCRRTDGKKWRCSKAAYPDSKYCERHMNRGRNRSRKPVESQSTSHSSSAVISHVTTGNSGGCGSFQNFPLHSVINAAEGPLYGSNVSTLQMELAPHGISDKEYRYVHGLKADEHKFSAEASGSGRGIKVDFDVDNTWRLMPSQVGVNSFLKPSYGTQLQSDSLQLRTPQNLEPMINATLSKQGQQQHCFFGSKLGSPGPVQQEHHPMRPFFDEWPNTGESWSGFDDQRSNKNAFTTQLSISVPAVSSEFYSRGACSPKDT
ncbi:growth-regulating factor 4-like isoform X2 [Cornus florida]|uniref:growth-regulating factor 4-like isoform X2 n=1 Tax=Cornus florida TaxID=4283 RepID=UPI002897D3CB|nr:growth-regulating factor 4-like isoform X2 [Cornus florida]